LNAQKVCEKIINHLVAEGFRFQVHKNDLERAIMFCRGIDPRTIQKWIKALEVFGYITPAINDLGIRIPNIYQLNPTKIPKLMKLLKEKPQTKII